MGVRWPTFYNCHLLVFGRVDAFVFFQIVAGGIRDSLTRGALLQRKSERQKTSFSLDGEENVLADDPLTNARQTSGSLGCLDGCGIAGAPDMESALNQRLGRVISESNSSNGDAPAGSRATINERTVTWAEPRIKVIPPNSSRSVLMAMHTEYTR